MYGGDVNNLRNEGDYGTLHRRLKVGLRSTSSFIVAGSFIWSKLLIFSFLMVDLIAWLELK